MENEVWKDIVGYEGLYQVSNLGKIRSLNFNKTGKTKELNAGNNGNNYLIVFLYKNKERKRKYVHRIVIETFKENKNNYDCINHIDGNKLNNNINNLEWCSRSHNTKEAYRLGLLKASKSMLGKRGKNNHLSKKIKQFDLQNNYIKTWDSMRDVQRELNIFTGNISCCCKGKHKQANGFIWKYADEELQK